MKKFRKMATPLVLVIAMLLTLLAGCSSTDTTEPGLAPAESSAAVSETPGEQEETGAVEEAPSTAGETEEVEEEVEEEASLYPLVDELTTITIYAPFTSENTAAVDSFDGWAAFGMAEETTNVHVEWTQVPTDQYSELCPIMLASGDYTDIIFSLNQGYSLSRAFEEEIIIDLADYIYDYAPNYSALVDEIPNGWSRAANEDGSITAIFSLNSGSNQQGVLIRGDWLEDLGLDIPETVDEFLDMLYTFKDAYGVAPLQMSSSTQEGLIFTSAYDTPGYQISMFNPGCYWYQVDGVVDCGLICDGSYETLKIMNQLYNDNIFSRDFYTFGGGSMDSNKNGLVSGNVVGVLSVSDSMVDTYSDMVSGIEGAYWVAAKNPVLNAGDLIHFGNVDEVSTGSTCASISCDCDNVELCIQWLDYWYGEEGIMSYNYGIEGETYTIENDTPVYTDIIENNQWGVGYITAINSYCPVGNVPSYADIRRFSQYYTDLSRDAITLWSEASDYAYVMPTISMTEEESEQYNSRSADLETYSKECVLSFITGAMDLETQWDEYVGRMEAMGIYENQAIYQAALDRVLK